MLLLLREWRIVVKEQFIWFKWHQEAVCTHFTTWSIYKDERESIPWKHVVRCVRPTRHTSACLSGIKTSPGHLISRANIARKLLKVKWTSLLRCSHSPEEGSAIFRRHQEVRQRGRYWRSRLRFHRCVEERRPYFPNQKYVNNLIRDLGLSKSNA